MYRGQHDMPVVMSMLLYAGETWTLLDAHLAPLSVFHMTYLRRILGIALRDHVKNDQFVSCCKQPSLSLSQEAKG